MSKKPMYIYLHLKILYCICNLKKRLHHLSLQQVTIFLLVEGPALMLMTADFRVDAKGCIYVCRYLALKYETAELTVLLENAEK